MTRDKVELHFRERMHGVLACDPGGALLEHPVRLSWQPFSIDLAARISDLEEFLRSPRHRVGFRQGIVASDHFGPCPVTDAAIDLLVRGREHYEQEMCYRVCFSQGQEKFTLFGFKDINGTRLRPWYDTTTIFVEVYRGSHTAIQTATAPELVGVGVLKIPVLTFLIQLTTFRSIATTCQARISGYIRFMWFFTWNIVKPYWAGILRRTWSDVEDVKRLPDTEVLMKRARSQVRRPLPD
jgi:hypothetical protein